MNLIKMVPVPSILVVNAIGVHHYLEQFVVSSLETGQKGPIWMGRALIIWIDPGNRDWP